MCSINLRERSVELNGPQVCCRNIDRSIEKYRIVSDIPFGHWSLSSTALGIKGSICGQKLKNTSFIS